jgi:cell fate (sporulation/competence/biofilm development) regulator YmcA (YheA/YmcA/DUF963 family)
MKATDIKFRAKRIDPRGDKYDWIEGHYFISPLTEENANVDPKEGCFFLTGKTRHCIERDGVVYVIDPETLELIQPLPSARLSDDMIWKHIICNCRDKETGANLMDEQTYFEGAKFARDHYESALPETNLSDVAHNIVSQYKKISDMIEKRDQIISKQDELIKLQKELADEVNFVNTHRSVYYAIQGSYEHIDKLKERIIELETELAALREEKKGDKV